MTTCPFCGAQVDDAAVVCPSCSSDVRAPAPPVLASIEFDDRGGTLVFSSGTLDAVALEFARFFESQGFTLEEGDRYHAVYGLGSASGRAMGGGLVQRRKYSLSVDTDGSGVRAVYASAMSGWSGSLLGASKEKKGRKAVNEAAQGYFSRFQVL
jgi:hypothetical protein